MKNFKQVSLPEMSSLTITQKKVLQAEKLKQQIIKIWTTVKINNHRTPIKSHL